MLREKVQLGLFSFAKITWWFIENYNKSLYKRRDKL